MSSNKIEVKQTKVKLTREVKTKPERRFVPYIGVETETKGKVILNMTEAAQLRDQLANFIHDALIVMPPAQGVTRVRRGRPSAK